MPADPPPATVEAYLESLPEDRRIAIETIRRTIRRHLPKGYREGIQYGMIGWFVPHSRYPAGYHCDPRQPVPFVGLGNWKRHIGISLFCIYCDEELLAWFREAWRATGSPLDMGKGCVRIKRIEDVPLEVLGETIRRMPVETFLERYESIVPASKRRSATTATTASGTVRTRAGKTSPKAAKQTSPKTSQKTSQQTGSKVDKRTGRKTSRTPVGSTGTRVAGKKAGRSAETASAKTSRKIPRGSSRQSRMTDPDDRPADTTA